MLPTLDSMGAPASFTARRPNASNLPSFELPPPPLAGLHQKYQGFSHLSSSQAAPTASTLTSVGNLLTPPSNGSTDGLSPTSGVTSSQASYTPNSTGMWPPPNSASTPYGFQSSHQQQQQSQQSYAQHRPALFSPSLNSMMRGNSSPSASESLPPPPYELPQFAASSSLPMSSSSLPAVHTQHQQHHLNGLMGGQDSTAVSQASPISQHDAYSRQPPTPTYYSQPTSTNGHGHHNSYSYSTGPSPTAHSPLNSASSSSNRTSSANGMAPQFSRTYTYPFPGPVLSNVNNPNGQLQMVGGMAGAHGMMPGGFNSGHAAAHLQMYGHHHAGGPPHHQHNPQNDRPFRCDQCPQSFNRNHDLKRHKRIHLAVKPFPCGHCDKSFSRKDALKRHILVKGCGKSSATTDIKELDGSSSPSTKSESVHNSPLVASV